MPSSGQLRLEPLAWNFALAVAALLSQLWLYLEAWMNCSSETIDTVLGLDELAEKLKAANYLLALSAYSATCD